MRPLASRLPALALVAGAHLGALFVIVTLTRTQVVRLGSETAPIFIWLFAPRQAAQSEHPAAAQTRAVQRTRHHAPRPEGSEPSTLTPPMHTPADSKAIDWAAEAHAAAARQLERDEHARQREGALAPPRSTAFAPPSSRKPEFHWDHAHTHRIEALEGGGIAVNLTDRCVLVIFGVIPLAACALGRIPPRGDLFEHLHDPPEFGAWKGQ